MNTLDDFGGAEIGAPLAQPRTHNILSIARPLGPKLKLSMLEETETGRPWPIFRNRSY